MNCKIIRLFSLIVFLFFTFYSLVFTSSTAFAERNKWSERIGQGNSLSNYYCDKGIGFYKSRRYEQAKLALEKALLADSGCKTAREYLRKIRSTVNRGQPTVYSQQRTENSKGQRTEIRRKRIRTEVKEEKIEKEIKEIEKEIEIWENYKSPVIPLRAQASHTLAGTGQSPVQPLNLGEVVVTATKTEREVSNVSASVSLIKKGDIEESPARYVDDILRNTAGIGIERAKGGLSSPSTFIYMRGFSQPRAVALMRDGVPINRAVCGGTLFNEVSLSVVDKIEVVRGASSSLYGSGAMGGVINIFTKEPEEETRINLEQSYGDYATRESKVTLSAPLSEDTGYILSYNHLESDGFVAFDGREKERDAKTPAEKKALTNMRKAAIPNYRDVDNAFGKLVYKIDPFSSLSLSHSFWKDEIGQGRKHLHTNIERNRATLGYKSKGLDADVSANVFYLNEEFVHYFDNAKYPSADKPFEELAQIRHKPGKDTGMNLNFSFPLSENQIFTSGIDYRWAEMEDKLDTIGPPAKKGLERAIGRQHQASLFFEDEISLGKLSLNLSGRGDWYRTYGGYHYKKQWNPKKKKYVVTEEIYPAEAGGVFNPKAGLNYHFSDSTTLRGSVGRAFHMPYLYSLYGTTECPPGKINEGNPNLKPEYVIAYELGIDQRLGENFALRLTGFYNDINDWMDKSYFTKSTNKWSNIDEVETAGVELEGEYNLFNNLTLFTNYNYLHTEIDKYTAPPCEAKKGIYEGKRLSDQPQHRANFGFAYNLPKNLIFSLKCRYVGSRYDDLENTKKLENYLTADLLASKKLAEFIEVALEINDLFNESWHDDADWLASPGRTFTGRVKMTF